MLNSNVLSIPISYFPLIPYPLNANAFARQMTYHPLTHIRPKIIREYMNTMGNSILGFLGSAVVSFSRVEMKPLSHA